MAARRIRSKKHTKKRQEARLRKIKLYTGGIILLLALLVGVTHLNAVKIESITAETESYISAEQIEDLAAATIKQPWLLFIERDNILLLPRDEITHQVRSISSRIDDVDIQLDGLRGVSISITNRQPAVKACASAAAGDDSASVSSDLSECYLVDENGLIFARVDQNDDEDQVADLLTYTANQPLRSGSQLLPSHRFQALQSFVQVLEEDMQIQPQLIGLEPAGDVSIQVVSASNTGDEEEANGFVDIRVNIYQDLSQIAANLKTVIDNQSFVTEEDTNEPVSPFTLEYIDMRFENKIFYR